MYKKDTPEFKHHIATHGQQSKFGYKDFVPLFKAEKFDPNSWAELFKKLKRFGIDVIHSKRFAFSFDHEDNKYIRSAGGKK